MKTFEEWENKLRQQVKIKNRMCSSMYFNMLSDECLKMADELYKNGGDKKRIQAILNGEL